MPCIHAEILLDKFSYLFKQRCFRAVTRKKHRKEEKGGKEEKKEVRREERKTKIGRRK